MTRTQDRLQDALQASAARVRDERLRPLPGLRLEPAVGRRPRPAPAGRRGWLAPAAAGVSVALVIGLVLALTGGPRHHVGRSSAGRVSNTSSAAAVPRPRYFAQFSTTPAGTTVAIMAVTSDAVLTSAAAPQPAGWTLRPYAMAAAPDDRTFYIAFHATGSGPASITQIWIYRLRITDSRLTRVAGGVFPSVAYFGVRGSMAVSPDGTRLALTVATPVRGYAGPGSINEIVVVDLRTGGHVTWQGGLDLVNHIRLIPDVSWTADGRSIVFLTLWCNPAIGLDLCENASVPTASRMEQVRSILVASGGGSLTRGTVLLGQRGSRGGTVPVIAHAIAGPRPGELTLVLLSGRTTTAGAWPVATVERVAAGTGSMLGTDYRLAAGRGGQAPRDIELGADPGGRHLLLTYNRQHGFRTGWIGQGKYHPLPIRQPYLGFPITAW